MSHAWKLLPRVEPIHRKNPGARMCPISLLFITINRVNVFLREAGGTEFKYICHRNIFYATIKKTLFILRSPGTGLEVFLQLQIDKSGAIVQINQDIRIPATHTDDIAMLLCSTDTLKNTRINAPAIPHNTAQGYKCHRPE